MIARPDNAWTGNDERHSPPLRETLTVLAGLLVLALLAALIGPGFVDWRGYRPQIEARLELCARRRDARRRRHRLALVAVAPPDPGRCPGRRCPRCCELGRRRAVDRRAGAVGPGARRFRFADAQAEGRGRSPSSSTRREPSASRQARVAACRRIPASTKLSIRRSALIWPIAGKAPVTLMPVAAEVSAVSLAGPWRIEAKSRARRCASPLARSSPMAPARQGSITGDAIQIGFDGNFPAPCGSGRRQCRAGGSLHAGAWWRAQPGRERQRRQQAARPRRPGARHWRRHAARSKARASFFRRAEQARWRSGRAGSISMALTKALSERAGFEHAPTRCLARSTSASISTS